MEIQNPKKEIAQVVRIKVLIVILFLANSCALKTTQYEDNIKIKIFKSETGNTYLNLHSIEIMDSLKAFPATFHVNNLIFSPTNYNSLNLKILPGNFKITAGGIGKEWATIDNLKIKMGDSIEIRFLLKNDFEPLY